jgi:hypothetical protein
MRMPGLSVTVRPLLVTRTQWMWRWWRYGDTSATSTQPDKIDCVRNVELSAEQRRGRAIVEYWIPADDLNELNANIVGLIEVVDEYHHDISP